MTLGAKNHKNQAKQPVGLKMAGKKRKRGTKKVPREDKNKRSGFIEEKKTKLIDEQKKPDEELFSDKLESCLETVAECKTNAVDFLKGEDSKLKYVPPFTRKAKRTLNRTGVPVSPVTKPLKRPWRGAKQFSTDAPLTERSPPVRDDEQGNEYQNSQKIEEEEKKMKEDEEEEEIDVVGIKPKSSCSQKGENFVLCKNQTTGKKEKVGKEEFLSSSTMATEVPSEVKVVLHSIIEDVCKIEHCNSNKSEAALDETTSGKGIESCGSALKSSTSIQIPADNSTINSFEPVPEIANFKERYSQDGKEVSDCKIEVPHWLNDVKGGNGWSKRNIHVQCNQGDISGSERDGTTHNPERGHSEANLTSMNCVDLLSDRRSKKGHCPTSNMDADLTHTETNFSDSKSENDLSSKTLLAEDTEMKSSMDVHLLMSEDVPGSAICLGDPANELNNLEKLQSPDQMVPAQCEPVTVLSQRIPDCTELTMKCHQNGRDMCHSSSECLETPDNIHEEDKTKHHADETEDGSHCTDPKAGLRREIQVEESQPSDAETALEIYAYQETNTSSVKKGHTVPTGSESSTSNLQCSSPCKETEGRLTYSEQGRSAFPSCDQPPVCSSLGSEDEILEFDCLMAMDCTDSQLVSLESFPDQPSCHKQDTSSIGPTPTQANPSEMSSHSDVTGNVSSKKNYVPTDNGMIKGLISELSALNKFIMGAWKDLENQKKQRQARLKLGKSGKKLKK